MAWLDDRIRDHPKIRKASPVAFQWWAFALAYCSAHGTGGHLDDAIEIMRVPKSTVNELVRVGLWDREEDGIWVHDWQEHNDKRDDAIEKRRAQARERQNRHRAKVRLSRKVTRDSHAEVTRDDERDRERDRPRGGAPTRVAPAHARSRDHDHDHDQGTQGPSSSVHVDDDTLQKLQALGPGTDQLDRWLHAADAEPERFAACLTAAETKGENVAAYLDTLIENGSHPQTTDEVDAIAIWNLYVNGYGWDDATSEDQVLDELRRRHERIEGFELPAAAALPLWKAARNARYPEDDPEPVVSTTAANDATVTR